MLVFILRQAFTDADQYEDCTMSDFKKIELENVGVFNDAKTAKAAAMMRAADGLDEGKSPIFVWKHGGTEPEHYLECEEPESGLTFRIYSVEIIRNIK